MFTSLALLGRGGFPPTSLLGAPSQPPPTPYYFDPLSTRATTSLPDVTGADIDRTSLTVGGGGVLVYYISNDVDFATANQAVIVVHGLNRDADNSFADVRGAVKAANKEGVVIMAVRKFHHFLNLLL